MVYSHSNKIKTIPNILNHLFHILSPIWKHQMVKFKSEAHAPDLKKVEEKYLAFLTPSVWRIIPPLKRLAQ